MPLLWGTGCEYVLIYIKSFGVRCQWNSAVERNSTDILGGFTQSMRHQRGEIYFVISLDPGPLSDSEFGIGSKHEAQWQGPPSIEWDFKSPNDPPRRRIMAKKYILTAFSEDRPGIVASISQLIYENDCSLEDSAMTNLSGEFAIMLLFTPMTNGSGDDLEEKLSAGCRRLEREKGITAFIRPVTLEEQAPKADILKKTVHVEGLDQAGIVYKVSRFLADNQVNIIHLNSEKRSSPQSGAAIYAMTILVEVPITLSLQDLENGLNRIGEELNVDVTIT
jgi:glycine cleavage system transcriptional repressor